MSKPNLFEWGASKGVPILDSGNNHDGVKNVVKRPFRGAACSFCSSRKALFGAHSRQSLWEHLRALTKACLRDRFFEKYLRSEFGGLLCVKPR